MTIALRVFVLLVMLASIPSEAKESASASRSTRQRRGRASIGAPQRPANLNEAQDRQDLKNLSGHYMDKGLMATQNMNPTCFDCAPGTDGVRTPSPACRDTYADLYSKDTVDFRYVFGYIDNFNAEDGPAREAAIETLTRPCRGWYQGACGFQFESDDDGEVLVKQMTGPDGKPKRVRLTIVSSSASTNLGRNRRELAASQARTTAHARQVFEEGLRNADMMIYVGHGRDGGGPSFEPGVLRRNTLPGAAGPGLTPEGREAINYDYYKTNRQSHQAMIRALQSTPRPPKLFGMFACYTEKYFARDVERATTRDGAPRTGFVGSTDYTPFEAMYSQSLMMLDSVLQMRCEDDFVRAVNPVTSLESDPTRPPVAVEPPNMRNVFSRPVPRATIPVRQPSPAPTAEPPPVVQEEPVPTGETVREERPPATFKAGGDLSQPMLPTGSPSGAGTQIRRDGDR